MKEGISENKMKILLNKLNISALQLIRKNEKIWKEKFKEKILSESQIINALVKHPKLIKRPIVINGQKAVVGRPTEKINNVL